ncbi:ABC transporter substrate-binding protein [Rhodospirillaceae bacterium SYSU D60014]|uniref:ABC transporter substrate-binding protein n=1 Tax=Virgifigura deserti TaxID=2268457 RepID=UPI000E66D2EF
MPWDDELKQPVDGWDVTRREFMGRAAALGVSTALATSLVGAPVRAQTGPQKGGNLKLGIDGAESTDSLDPATVSSTYPGVVTMQWGNCLVEIDANNEAIPELAESWEPNADATQWVFKLRKGVQFHNGKEMTAADVVHSINYHRNEKSESGAKGYLEPIADVKASDTHEVTITMATRHADVPYIMADFHLVIMPEDSDPASGIGTGAFVIEAFEPGLRTVATRNPNYWKEGRGHVDRVETLAINDLTARTSALQTGSVHFISRVDPKTVSLLERAPNVTVLNVPSAAHYTFPMRCDIPPFDNVDLRLALKHAVDRQDIVDKILRGYGKVGNDHPIPEFDPFYAADLPQHEFDPDKAKHHFRKAGVDGPVVLYISDAAFTGATDAAILFKEHAARAGIAIEVQRTPEDGYWSDVWMQKPFFGSYWTGRPTADLMLSVAYKSDAPWNEAFWKREDFDKVLAAARGELDSGKRKQMYHDLQEMIWRDGGQLIPMFNNVLFAGRNDLGGFVPSPVMTGLRVAEQLYFAG